MVSGLALVGLAAVGAQALQLPVPDNGYLGNLRAPITCNALGTNMTLGGQFAGTGPLVLEAGQKFYANDIAVNITLPALLGTLTTLLGVDHIDTRTFVNLSLINLSPALLNPIPEGVWVNGTKLNALSTTQLQFPKEGVLGGFGPITAGAANTKGLVYLGDVLAELYLYDKNDNLITQINATCPAPPYNDLLATFNTIEATSDDPPVLSIGNGYLIDYPPLEDNTQFGCFDFTYECAADSNGTYPLDVRACGLGGGAYEVGQQFNFSNITALVTIPENVVSGMKELFPGTTHIDYTALSFFSHVTNAQPSAINAVPAGGLNQTMQVPKSGNLTFLLPATTQLNFGPFTVDDKPGDFTGIYIGNSTSHVVYKSASGQTTGQQKIVCKTAVKSLEGIGVTIVPKGALSQDGQSGI